jgi:DNA-directed RNA polymerase specialized sigma24 family protein
MNNVLQFHSNRRDSKEKDPCATREDFHQLFAREMTNLLRLSLHLTADSEKAEKCLILAMRDCFERSVVSKKWAHLWARRMVVRNAIRLVLSTENDISCETGSDFYLQPSTFQIEALRKSSEILDLPDFDRLVFVICVLERYSILDCALLLRRSPKDVHDAITRATNRVVPVEERNDQETTAMNRTGTHDIFCDQ